jgi:hypothetical protein
MPLLTLQEVIDRINRNCPSTKKSCVAENRSQDPPHRPEFYVPRITRRLVSLMFGAVSS